MKEGEDEENGIDIKKHIVNTHAESEAALKVFKKFSQENNKWKSLMGESEC